MFVLSSLPQFERAGRKLFALFAADDPAPILLTVDQGSGFGERDMRKWGSLLVLSMERG